MGAIKNTLIGAMVASALVIGGVRGVQLYNHGREREAILKNYDGTYIDIVREGETYGDYAMEDMKGNH